MGYGLDKLDPPAPLGPPEEKEEFPGWTDVCIQSDEATKDLKKIFEMLPNRTEDTVECVVQLRLNIKTHAIERIYPIRSGGKFVRLRISTKDGFVDFGAACDEVK